MFSGVKFAPMTTTAMEPFSTPISTSSTQFQTLLPSHHSSVNIPLKPSITICDQTRYDGSKHVKDTTTQTESFKVTKLDTIESRACALTLVACMKNLLMNKSETDVNLEMLKSIERLTTDPSQCWIESVHHLGIHSLIGLSNKDLKEKIFRSTGLNKIGSLVHILTLQALLTRSVYTVPDLLKFLYFIVGKHEDRVFLYAIKHAVGRSHTMSLKDFEPMGKGDRYIECYAIAISLFCQHESCPVKAIQNAVELGEDLIVTFTSDLIAAAYGLEYLPAVWGEYKNSHSAIIIGKRFLSNLL